jgi:hypothetical protein
MAAAPEAADNKLAPASFLYQGAKKQKPLQVNGLQGFFWA